MKKILLIISFLILPFFSFAETENVGIIKGIWFSESQFFDGDDIRIYTAVQNNSGDDASGNIEFFDNGESLGVKTFSALNNRVVESWIDTVAVSGEHQFSVRITQLKKGNIVAIPQEIISERLTIIKKDSDGDNIPDDIDTDDDGDGISDLDEIAAGSDPLDAKSVPVSDQAENETGQNNSNTFVGIIKNIFDTNNPSSTSELKNNEKKDDLTVQKKNSISSNSELLKQSPEIAQKIAEQNNIIKSLVQQISRLQNSGQEVIKHEQQRIISNDHAHEPISENGKIVRVKNKTEISGNKVKKEVDKKSSIRNILMSIYNIFLNIFGWLFSVWWFVVVLLFLGIYIFLKLLFKIFGRNTD